MQDGGSSLPPEQRWLASDYCSAAARCACMRHTVMLHVHKSLQPQDMHTVNNRAFAGVPCVQESAVCTSRVCARHQGKDYVILFCSPEGGGEAAAGLPELEAGRRPRRAARLARQDDALLAGARLPQLVDEVRVGLHLTHGTRCMLKTQVYEEHGRRAQTSTRIVLDATDSARAWQVALPCRPPFPRMHQQAEAG